MHATSLKQLSLFAVVLTISAPSLVAQTHGQWTVAMRAIYNPLPIGQCTPIEIVVRDASGAPPLRPDGRQLDWQDFELSFAAATPDAFAWSDERRRYLCARAPTAAYASVVARYPGAHLQPHERVPGVVAQQAVEVLMQSVPPAAAAPAASYPAAGADPYSMPGVQPGQYEPTARPADTPGYPSAAAGGQPPSTGYEQYSPPQSSPGAAPAHVPPPPPPADPYAESAASAAAAPGYAPPATVPTGPAAAAGSPPGYPQVPTGAAYGATAAAGAEGVGGQPSQAVYPSASASASVATAAPAAQPEEKKKKKGGFLQKLGKHIKDKADEVTTQTAENLTTSATQVVDATAETGSNLVAGASAEVSSVAQSKVGSVGNALAPSSLKLGGHGDNLDLAIKSGRAVMRSIRFNSGQAVLDATGRLEVRRLASVLNENPGSYYLKVYVDPAPGGDPQRLSERRADAVKSALISSGVSETRLRAAGYGATDPLPEAQPGGGPPSSERVEIWKVQ